MHIFISLSDVWGQLSPIEALKHSYQILVLLFCLIQFQAYIFSFAVLVTWCMISSTDNTMFYLPRSQFFFPHCTGFFSPYIFFNIQSLVLTFEHLSFQVEAISPVLHFYSLVYSNSCFLSFSLTNIGECV